MRCVFLILVVALPLIACASGERTTISKKNIVELAEKDSYQYCHDHSAMGEFKRARCEFFAYLKDGNWVVAAHPIYENSSGKEVIVEGGDRLYYYSSEGKMLKIIEN